MKSERSRFHLRRKVSACCAVLCLIFCCVGASYGIMIPQTIDQLVANSTDIVSGTVVDQQAQWNPTHEYIYTTVMLQIDARYKGGTADTIVAYYPGGTVNDTTLSVEHAPTFVTGEDVIVFLDRVSSMYRVTSAEQGKYTVINMQIVEKQIPVSTFLEEVRQATHR